MKLGRLLTMVLLFICLSSCGNDDEISSIGPSTRLVQAEGEGGSSDISFNGEDWEITGVINNNGDSRISGNSYSINNDLILENQTLSLKGTGRMEALWRDKGFVITKNAPSSINIELKENSSGEAFSFTINLQSGNETAEIDIEQKKSEGYSFKSIAYVLKENDGDSIFMIKGTNYKFDIQSPQEFTFSPFAGIGINRRTYFESEQEDAFVWLKNDSIGVKIPSSIENGMIYTSDGNELYTDLTNVGPHEFVDQLETITLPSGQSTFYTQIEFRRRRVSYTLSLINNRTKEIKTVDGRWIEVTPTGKYEIKWKG